MNFQHIAKLAVIRSKLTEMKLHSSLIGIRWEVVPADVCKYMRISLNKKMEPVLEVSDEVLATNSLDTIVIMFIHEFSHRIFKHLEKLEIRRSTKDGALLSMLEYNLISDFVIDDFLANNTSRIKIDADVGLLLISHIKALQYYFNDLYLKYDETYKIASGLFNDKPLFTAMARHAGSSISAAIKYPQRNSYQYAYVFEGMQIRWMSLTFDNIVDTSVMIKKMIIEMRRAVVAAAKEKAKNQKKINSQTDMDNIHEENNGQGGKGEKEAESANDERSSDTNSKEEPRPPQKQDNSIVDPTLPDKKIEKSTNDILAEDPKDRKDVGQIEEDEVEDGEASDFEDSVLDPFKNYQQEAIDRIIENYCKDSFDKKRQEDLVKNKKNQIQKLSDMQNQLSDSLAQTGLGKTLNALHDPDTVTTELVADELAAHKNNQFNKMLSKIYSKISSYGDNATRVDYVWKNPRPLMYLQEDYIIQDVKEMERAGKKKIVVYIDKSGSMGMGPAKVVNSILKTFSKDLIDVDIWFWNDQIRDREDTREHKPYKIEDLMSGGYPQSNGYTCLYKVYEHVFEKYKNQEDLTIIIISDFEDNTVDWIENSQYNPNKNRHWQYLNVHIITREYERSNGFIRFDRLNKLLGVDNPSITAKILND